MHKPPLSSDQVLGVLDIHKAHKPQNHSTGANVGMAKNRHVCSISTL